MNEWPASSPEGSPDSVSEFVRQLSKALGERLSVEDVDGTYEIEAEQFSLTFTLDDSVFEIRNIDTRGSSGVGGKIIDAINDFAEDKDLEVRASNVRDEAIGFWTKMGFAEGSTPDEYFRT